LRSEVIAAEGDRGHGQEQLFHLNPSLPRSGFGMESVVQTAHLQGFFGCRGLAFAENRGHVRPSSPVVTTLQRAKVADLQALLEAL
jgi:hypothetical protein